MNSLLQLEIPKRSMQCAHHGEKLLPGMEIFSLLMDMHETNRVARKDYCCACWHGLGNKNANGNVKGFWKSRIPKKEVIDKSSRIDRAFDLLRSFQNEGDAKEDEAFILCLYLSHARQIVLRQEFLREGIAYHLYEVLRKEEFITIKAPKLSDIQIEKLQRSLASQLECVRV